MRDNRESVLWISEERETMKAMRGWKREEERREVYKR